MRIVLLPFNATEGQSPALGRQLTNFIAEVVRANSEADINAVSYITQVEDEGQQRALFVNVAETLLEPEWLKQMFDQPNCDLLVDGLLKRTEDTLEWTLRIHKRENIELIYSQEWSFPVSELIDHTRKAIAAVVEKGEIDANPSLLDGTLEFGTTNGTAFTDFLEGYDALRYIQQANGAVTRDFTPEPAIGLLLKSIEEDTDYIAPIDTIANLARACAQFRIGSFEMLKVALEKASQLAPKDFRIDFALGEIYQSVNDAHTAADFFERAIDKNPDEPALITRLGIAQLSAGMPVNAERNFRKALEMEGPDKPSADYLATVLQQTGREHEISAVWKGIIDEYPQNGVAHAKYAGSLLQAGKREEAEQAFESALESVEDNIAIKRWYAPYLARDKQDLDRAMDFYEDCLDVAPNEIPLLLEYAQTLSAADRDFEVPQILKQVLESNPDPNTRAETLAWKLELEQPKRIESVQNAQIKMNEGDFETAVRELKPLRNWLSEYWKLWALLGASLNKLEQFEEAEEAAGRLIQLFPGCEPAYVDLMNALNGQGKNEEAYNVMRYAAGNNPQSLGLHVNLALAAKRSGRDDEGRQLAKQIREAVGPNEDIEPLLAEIEA